MNRQTFDSRGSPNTAQVGSMISLFNSNNIPTSMDDAWGENRSSHQSKNHTEQDIRRAFWKATIVGGAGGLIRGGATGGCHNGFMCINRLEQEWESEQWLKFINPFIRENLGSTFGSMSPNTTVAGGSKVYALADSSYSKILYLYIGTNDTYNAGGGSLTAKLSGLSKNYNARWFDPRSGNFINIGILAGGKDHNVNPPSSDDWVLLLTTDGPTSTSTPTSSPPSGGLPGDGNNDEVVDMQDYGIWIINFGLTDAEGPSQGDYNNDGSVDGQDYSVWLANFTS